MTGAQTNQPLVITRSFNAPAEKVWQAWTDASEFTKWWGPKDFTCPSAQLDARVGGKSFSCMRAPDGKEIWGIGIYKEVIPNKRLVVTDSFSDAKGNVVPSGYYGMEGFPLELQITVDFTEQDDKTTMTLTHEGMPAGEIFGQARDGWNESFDKLAKLVEKTEHK